MLDLAEEIVPIAELQAQFTMLLNRTQTTGRPIIVTQGGNAVVVIVQAAQYQRAQSELAVLRAILVGERDVRAGRIVSHDDVEMRLDALMMD